MIGKDFLEIFTAIDGAIDQLGRFAVNLHEAYKEASVRAMRSEQSRMEEREARLVAEEKALAEAQNASVLAAKYAGAIETLATTQQEKDEARRAGEAAAAYALELQGRFTSLTEQIAQERVAFEQFRTESLTKDQEQDAERANVLSKLGTVREALQGLAAKGEEQSGDGYGSEVNS
jgi:antirestriction protein